MAITALFERMVLREILPMLFLVGREDPRPAAHRADIIQSCHDSVADEFRAVMNSAHFRCEFLVDLERNHLLLFSLGHVLHLCRAFLQTS